MDLEGKHREMGPEQEDSMGRRNKENQEAKDGLGRCSKGAAGGQWERPSSHSGPKQAVDDDDDRPGNEFASEAHYRKSV